MPGSFSHGNLPSLLCALWGTERARITCTCSPAINLLIWVFFPVIMLSHELQGSERVWETRWRFSCQWQAICSAQKPLFLPVVSVTHDKVSRCGEKNLSKSLSHWQPVVPTHLAGVAVSLLQGEPRGWKPGAVSPAFAKWKKGF